MTQTDLNDLNQDTRQGLNIFKMFTSPMSEFEKLRGEYSLVQPIVTLIALIMISTFILALTLSGGTFGVGSGMLIFGVLFSFIGLFIGFLFAAVILWGLTHMFGGDIRFKQALSIHILTTIIGVLGGFINSAIALLFNLNIEVQYTGLGALVSQEDPMWAFLSVIDIFSIWTGILVAFGVKTITSLSWGKSIMIVLLTILIPAFFSFLFNTLLQGMPG